MEFSFLEERGGVTSFSNECSTLVLPALSIGNVGQLSIDLLISSTRAKKVAFLDEPSVLPCVGNDAYGPLPTGDLALPLEAYESTQFSLTLIQQRSPVLKGMLIDFSKNFAKFISSIGKKHIVILSSLDSGRRKVIDESSTMQVHYISSANDDGSDVKCEELGYKRLNEYIPSQNKWKYLSQLAEGKSSTEEILDFEDELVDDDYHASLPFASLFSCCKAEGLKVTCLLCYCSEGDNMPDSFRMAEAACKLLGLSPNEFQGNQEGWTIPLSWHSVYGPPPELSMF